MKPTALDTSVIVAALATWHPRHDRARQAVAALRTSGPPIVLPTHALIEAFSVLTRLPDRYRLPPETALHLLRSALEGRASVVSPALGSEWRLLDDAVAAGARGGAIHDFEILACAADAGAGTLLTYDPDDFRRFGHRGVEIVEP